MELHKSGTVKTNMVPFKEHLCYYPNYTYSYAWCGDPQVFKI